MCLLDKRRHIGVVHKVTAVWPLLDRVSPAAAEWLLTRVVCRHDVEVNCLQTGRVNFQSLVSSLAETRRIIMTLILNLRIAGEVPKHAEHYVIGE